MKYGKRIVLIFMLFIPQDILANDLYGSIEGSAGLLQSHKINIADAFGRNQKNPTLNFNSNYAYKVGLGFGFAKRFDIRMFYSQLSDNNQKHEGFFENTYPLGAGSTEKEGFIYNESKGLKNGTGSANGKYDLEEIDLEFGITFRFDPGIYYRFIVGGRYGKYKQDMWVNRWGECLPEKTDEIPKCEGHENFGSERYLDQKIDGFGPRFGLSVVTPIKNSNFSFVGSGSYSILYAKKHLYDSVYRIKSVDENNNPVYEHIGLFDNDSFKITDKDVVVRYMNLEGGVQYKIKVFKSSLIFLEGGYKYSVHYGVLNTYGKILKKFDAIPNNFTKNIVARSFGNIEEDLVSHGPFLRIGFKF